KRIFTIESGSRELSSLKRENGRILNNVVHTLSRPSDNSAFDISQEDLVVLSLRFNPDVVAVGEMRDTEAYSAVEASLTGHTVLSTVHSGAGGAAHMRIALLCQKRFPIDFNTSLAQAGQAFPIVVFTHQLENNTRKIMDISECEILPTGERRYSTLYRFNILRNASEGSQMVIEGRFEKPNSMSESLIRKLIQYGVPQNELLHFRG
ncbi:MAG: ATPase, T2SS/T4P/T4SS family, partial [Ethanoligenens sp.]